MVALVIFALGLLGAAGLLISALKSSQFSYSSSRAISLARDYGELMRMTIANPTAEGNKAPSVAGFLLDTSQSRANADPAACNGAAQTCTPLQMAKAMVDEWAARVPATLPGGRAEVCQAANVRDADGNLQWGGCDSAGSLIAVKMGWVAKKTANGGSAQSWMTDNVPRTAIALGIASDWAVRSTP